ncbi:MAG: choice-of-anchor D domain-containing protein [bacterium]
MKTYYTITKQKLAALVFVVALLFSFTSRNADAQASKYVLLSASTSGTALPAGNIITYGYNCTACGFGTYPIGFNFAFTGTPTTYSSFVVYSNGMISLNGGSSNPNSNNLSGTTIPHIAPFWQVNGRMSTGASWRGCPQGYISYQTTGSAPNRILTVMWNSITLKRRNSGYQGEALSTWQTRLYEVNGNVEFYYAHMTPTDPSCSARSGSTSPTAAAIGIGNGAGVFVSLTPAGGSAAPSRSNSAANSNVDINATSIPDNTLWVLGNPPNRQLSVSPKTLNFGIQTAGSSTTLVVTACGTADGVAPVILSGTQLQGAPDFTVTGPIGGSSLAPGTCATYNVTFKPTRGGPRTALLSINSNGSDSGSQSVVLSGSGVVSDYTYDSTVLFRKTRTRLGDTLIQWIHFNVTGDAPLVFTAFNLTGFDAGQYSVVRMPPNGLLKGAYDSIGVAYIPTIEGKHVAKLTIISNAFLNSSVTVDLQGTGTLPHIVLTPPNAMLFDSTAEGDTICKNLTIWNPGTDTLRIKANFLSSNDGDFHITPLVGSDTAIAPDQKKTIGICFIPLQQGYRQGRILISTNIRNTFEIPSRDTGSTYQIDLRGSGLPLGVFANAISGLPILDSVVVGKSICRMDTIKNNGDADILVTSYTLTGTNSADFTQTGLPATPFILKARDRMVINLCGKPGDLGLRNGLLTLAGTTGGRKVTLPIGLGVYGLKSCASPAPIALFAGASGKIIKGTKATLCDTITNCGEVAAVYSATLVGTDASKYTLANSTSGTIAPGATATFCVEFNASDLGPTNAQLKVTSPDVAGMTIPLTGEGTCATLTATPSIADAGDVGQGETKNITFQITNSGTAPWSPNDSVIAGSDKDAFKFVSMVPPAPLAPGASATVTIAFHPPYGTKGKSFVANIAWPNGGPCQNAPVSVDLKGNSIVSAVKEVASNGFSLEQSYPNPTQGKTSFTFVTPTESEVRITLVDLTGRTLETLISGRVSGGEHLVNFDASHLTSGTYIYMFESGATKLSKQFIVTK